MKNKQDNKQDDKIKKVNGKTLERLHAIVRYHLKNPLNINEIEQIKNLKKDLIQMMRSNDIYRFTIFPKYLERNVNTESEMKEFADVLNLWRNHVFNEVKNKEF